MPFRDSEDRLPRATKGRRRRNPWQTAAIASVAIAGAWAAIELLAYLDLRRQIASRSRLGDLLFTKIRGEGRPVVLLAGFGGTTSYWGDGFPELAREHRVVMVDALGFGRSPWPDIDYTLEDHLGALRRTLVHQRATERVTLAGHSLGAILAAYYAQRHPGEVERLVLIGTPIFDDRHEAMKHVGELSIYGRAHAFNRGVARQTCTVMAAFRPLWMRLAPHLDRSLPQQVAADWMLNRWRSVDGTLRNVVYAHPIRNALEGLQSEVTMIHGDNDAVTDLAKVRALARQVGARLIITPDSHLAYVTNSRRVVTRAMAGDSANLDQSPRDWTVRNGE